MIALTPPTLNPLKTPSLTHTHRPTHPLVHSFTHLLEERAPRVPLLVHERRLLPAVQLDDVVFELRQAHEVVVDRFLTRGLASHSFIQVSHSICSFD